jgi:hypothetical protein
MPNEEIVAPIVLRPARTAGLEGLSDLGFPIWREFSAVRFTDGFYRSVNRPVRDFAPTFHGPYEILRHWANIAHVPPQKPGNRIMPRGPKGEKAPLINAVHVMRTATGEIEDKTAPDHARKGGLKGGVATERSAGG